MNRKYFDNNAESKLLKSVIINEQLNNSSDELII